MRRATYQWRISFSVSMRVGRRYESASHTVVCESDRFRGVVTIEDALAAPPDVTVQSVMDAGAPIWLLVGLAGAMLAADIVGTFEAQLHVNILLAFFVPGIVYLADAVGTQTGTRGGGAGANLPGLRQFAHR